MVTKLYIVLPPFYRKEAGLEMDGHFLVRQVYEDAKTYDLVGAASKVLSECKSAKFCKSF